MGACVGVRKPSTYVVQQTTFFHINVPPPPPPPPLGPRLGIGSTYSPSNRNTLTGLSGAASGSVLRCNPQMSRRRHREAGRHTSAGEAYGKPHHSVLALLIRCSGLSKRHNYPCNWTHIGHTYATLRNGDIIPQHVRLQAGHGPPKVFTSGSEFLRTCGEA